MSKLKDRSRRIGQRSRPWWRSAEVLIFGHEQLESKSPCITFRHLPICIHTHIYIYIIVVQTYSHIQMYIKMLYIYIKGCWKHVLPAEGCWKSCRENCRKSCKEMRVSVTEWFFSKPFRAFFFALFRYNFVVMLQISGILCEVEELRQLDADVEQHVSENVRADSD